MTTHTHNNVTQFGHATIGCDCPNPEANQPDWTPSEPNEPHYHKVGGLFVACYHKCRHGVLTVKGIIASPAFWIGSTVSFPLEHALWTKVPFLHSIAVWAGL